jgi:hypothetical protein
MLQTAFFFTRAERFDFVYTTSSVSSALCLIVAVSFDKYLPYMSQPADRICICAILRFHGYIQPTAKISLVYLKGRAYALPCDKEAKLRQPLPFIILATPGVGSL